MAGHQLPQSHFGIATYRLRQGSRSVHLPDITNQQWLQARTTARRSPVPRTPQLKAPSKMSLSQPVIVYPPDDEGGRLVRIHGVAVGRAYGLWDMIVFLRRAGLDRGLADEDEIAASRLIEWIGGDPNMWQA
ncbi:hypothetical protein AB0N62_43330 [Streptomyces sp. NPDC093982]|uniref:hypothetical protein n=1 Tax=Streptomyces sp. NPDC093982 TaxID=3155077 RepID=UPI003427AC2B